MSAVVHSRVRLRSRSDAYEVRRGWRAAAMVLLFPLRWIAWRLDDQEVDHRA